MTESVLYERAESVSIIRLDDGKANAVSPDLLRGLNAGLDQAEKDGGAVALIGRPGKFSAGFDLTTLAQGQDATRQLVGGGAEFLVRMLQSPLPIAVGCTGHAVAMGALMLLAGDLRIGAAGPAKIGLNEVAIRMVLPTFAVKLASDRLSRRHLLRATTMAEIYDPATAVDAGYLDRLVEADEVESTTLAEASRLAALPRAAFAGTKHHLRAKVADAMLAGLAADMAEIKPPKP